jgi:hypothetical protein
MASGRVGGTGDAGRQCIVAYAGFMAKKKSAKRKRRAIPKRRFGSLIPGQCPPEWQRPCEPRLRELVDVTGRPVGTNDWFDLLLTRVPCLGEEVEIEAETYRVVRVTHAPVSYDGRVELGWHAMIEVELVPEPEPEARRRKPKRPAPDE